MMIDDRSDGGTLAFCTAYAANAAAWGTRYRTWIEAMHANGVAWNRLLIVDDGSPVLPEGWHDAAIVPEGTATPPGAKIVLFHFATRLGRGGLRDYPGWFRSFCFASSYAAEHGFAKIVHIESDAFVISDRYARFINGVRDGWIAHQLPTHRMPESAIQVIAGTGMAALQAFAARPYEDFKGKDIESHIPFTYLVNRFKGDRYGQFQRFVPPDADWSVQIPPPPHNDRSFFWWLNGQRSLADQPGSDSWPELFERDAGGRRPALRILAHISGAGDKWFAEGEKVGGDRPRTFVEGFALAADPPGSGPEVEYRATLTDHSHTPVCAGGEFCGARGKNARLICFAARTVGLLARDHDCEYAAEFADGTRAGPVRQGAPLGAASGAPIKSFVVRLVPRIPMSPLQAVAAPPATPPTARYRATTLRDLAADSTLDVAGGPRARPLDHFPAGRVTVPPLAFGQSDRAAQGYVVEHPAVPAWLLRDVTLHGPDGAVTVGDRVVAETLPMPAPLDMRPDDLVALPDRPRGVNIHTGLHLLGPRPDDYASWMLDIVARLGNRGLGTQALATLTAEPGASAAPLVLTLPLDRFWKWESLELILPPSVGRLAVEAEGDVFVQRLLYVPALHADGYATHPGAAPLFEAVVRKVLASGPLRAGGRRRLFVGRPGPLADCAARAGFERAEIDALPYHEQVRLFAGASHVIGEHVPALANIAFCGPGTTICELRADRGAPWDYRHLAAVRALRYGCVDGDVAPGLDTLLRDPLFFED